MDTIHLGDKVKDRITGFTGIATARCKYLNGCVQFCVEPKVDKDGDMRKHRYIDREQLIVVPDRKTSKKVSKNETGGVMPNCPE